MHKSLFLSVHTDSVSQGSCSALNGGGSYAVSSVSSPVVESCSTSDERTACRRYYEGSGSVWSSKHWRGSFFSARDLPLTRAGRSVKSAGTASGGSPTFRDGFSSATARFATCNGRAAPPAASLARWASAKTFSCKA